MAGNGMYGTPPSLATGSLPSDSEEVSTTFFNHLLHNHNPFSSSSKPSTLPPHRLSPPLETSGFFHSEDPFRFAQSRNHSGSEHPLQIGKPVGSSDAVADSSSSSFDFSDPYASVPAHVKDAAENEHFSAFVDDSDAKTSSREHTISAPENNPGGIICPVEKSAEASELASKQISVRTSSKRSRAAEVHNLSEKRRRSKINEKMKALQNLIPNSNKTDKASMLDEAIEYLKQLQLQVQMLMMRNGLSSHPICLSGGVQPMILPQTDLNFDEGNGFQNSTCGIALSANAESSVQPAFSFSKHCSISHQSVYLPSTTNITPSDTSSGFQPSVKDALCGSVPQLLLDTTKMGRTSSPDIS